MAGKNQQAKIVISICP